MEGGGPKNWVGVEIEFFFTEKLGFPRVSPGDRYIDV